jgi:hypothetical protein
MNRYDNFIYLAICETSLETFESTKFVTYFNYIKTLGRSFKTNTLSYNEKKHIAKISLNLDLLFSMSIDDNARYMVQFFELEVDLIIKLEKSVRLTKKAFPITGY